MADLTSLDGSFEKTLTGSNAIKDLPSIVQKYMMAGVSNNKLTFTKLFDEEAVIDNGGLVNVVAQLAMLDEKQQSAFLSLSKLDEKVKDTIKDLLQATKQGELFNSKLFEQEASKEDSISKGVLNEVMQAAGMKDTDGNYLLTNTKDVCDLLEQYANDANNAQKAQELFNAGLLEQSDNGYKVSASLLKLIGAKKSDIVITGIATAGQMAWNYAMQIGKQLLLSLGVAAVAFITTKLVDYIMNLKTRSEELVDAMNDSHDAAQQATKDVEEIQSKIDELNKSLKDAGVDKIEDIVDPTERERLQAINDMLQAQLELKKQLEKDANDKANADTSAVVNDKTEDSIVKTRTVNVSYAEGGANAGTHQVAEKVSKTESINEHSDYLDQLVQKRREMAAAGKEETQAYKDNEVEIEKEKTKIEELSSAVSEQMSSYSTDADSFAQYKDEYVAGTNAMTVATKALANAQGDTTVDTTNLDIFSEKVRQIKNDMDNGDSQQSDWKMFNGLGAFSGMTGESIINIDKDTTNQTDAEKAALEKLHQVADDNKISFENLIGVFETFGLLQVSNSSAADNYAEQLEKTMGVIDNIQSAYKNCSTAVEEYNKYRYLSIDSLQSLLQMDDQYLNTLELVNGKLQINQSAYADLLAAQYAEAQMEAISQAISELNGIAKGDAAEKAETFTEATEDEKNKLEALAPALKDATIGTGELAGALAAARSAENGDNTDEIEAKISSVMDALNIRLSLISTNMQSAMNSASGLKNQLNGFSNSTDNASKSTGSFLDAWSTLSSAMEEYNKWGGISFNTMDSLMGLDPKYTSCLKKQGKQLVVDATACRNLIKEELKQAAATDDGAGKVAQYNQVLEYLDAHAKDGAISLNQLKDAIEGVNTALDDAIGSTDDFQSGMQILHDLSTIDNPNGDPISDYDTLKKVTDLTTKYPALDGIFFDEQGNLNVDEDKLKTAAGVLIQAVIDAANDSGNAGLAKMWTDRLTKLNTGDISMTDFWNGFGTDISDANEKLDKFQSTFSTFRSAMEEIQETGGLKSQDILQELGQIDKSFLDKFRNDDGTYEIKATDLRDMYVSQLEPLMKQFDGSEYGDYLKEMYDAVRAPTEEEYEALAKATIEYKATEAKYNQAITSINSSDMSEEDKTAQTEAALAELNTAYNKAYQNVQETDAQVMAKLIAHWEDAKKAAENFKTTLTNIKTVLSDLVDLFNSGASKQTNDLQLWADAMNDEIDERIDKLDKQKEALDKENEAEERAIELTKAQDALARAQSQHTARVYGGNGYEWESSSADVRSAQQDLDDKRRQYRQADAEKAIEDEKKALNDLKDEYAKITKLIGKSLKDYNKQMKYTAQIQKMTLQDMKDSMTDYKDSVLENMKLVSAGTSMSDALSNLEKLISTLETLNDIWTFFNTKGQSTDGGGITGLAKNMNTLGEDIYNKGFGAAMKDFLGKFKDDVWETLATSDNSIVQMFRNAWTLIEDGAAKFFTSGGLGKTIGTGLQNMGGSVGNWVGGLIGKASGDAILTQLPSLAEAATAGNAGNGLVATLLGDGATTVGVSGTMTAATGGATSLAGIASSIPVIGAIAVGVNNIFQQTKKTVDENEKLWADTSKSTSEKIVGSLGNILYHIGPVEGWDKSIQYAKKAADGDGIWEKISNGFKSVYYGCGLGVILDNIWSTIKDIFHIQDKASKEADSKSTTTSTELDNKNLSVSTTTTKTTEVSDPTDDDSTKKKKWYESKFWFWNWGKKKATGDKGIKKSNLYNVDEQGSELIVRQPASGRYTYLETGDGVVPADITSKLFEMGGNPDKWFSDQMAKYSTNGIQTRNVDSSRSISIGDVVVSNPVGDADALARALVQKLPSAIDQQMNKR